MRPVFDTIEGIQDDRGNAYLYRTHLDEQGQTAVERVTEMEEVVSRARRIRYTRHFMTYYMEELWYGYILRLYNSLCKWQNPSTGCLRLVRSAANSYTVGLKFFLWQAVSTNYCTVSAWLLPNRLCLLYPNAM